MSWKSFGKWAELFGLCGRGRWKTHKSDLDSGDPKNERATPSHQPVSQLVTRGKTVRKVGKFQAEKPAEWRAHSLVYGKLINVATWFSTSQVNRRSINVKGLLADGTRGVCVICCRRRADFLFLFRSPFSLSPLFRTSARTFWRQLEFLMNCLSSKMYTKTKGRN